MGITIEFAGRLLWGLFYLSWIIAIAWTSPEIKNTSPLSSARDLIVYCIGFGLLFIKGPYFYALVIVPNSVAALLLVLEAVSFAFAWWARIHLGKLWSGGIKLRTGHRVVKSGPYALVRHPIYTAFIGASWSFALIVMTPTAILGATILTIQMATKAKREERFLRAELGASEYDSYAAQTPMLVPQFRSRRSN